MQFPDALIHWVLAGASGATVEFFGAGLTMYFERTPRPLWVLAVHYGSMLLVVSGFIGVLSLEPRAQEYAEYRRRTGMFIPFIGRH